MPNKPQTTGRSVEELISLAKGSKNQSKGTGGKPILDPSMREMIAQAKKNRANAGGRPLETGLLSGYAGKTRVSIKENLSSIPSETKVFVKGLIVGSLSVGVGTLVGMKIAEMVLSDQSSVENPKPVVIDGTPEKTPSPALGSAGSKFAIIINGDNNEARHIENTDRAVEFAMSQGFDEIYVAFSGELKDGKSPIVHQFEATPSGVSRLFRIFDEFDGNVSKDPFVFVYTTGHGGEDASQEPYIALTEGDLPGDQLIKYLEPIAAEKGHVLAVFDQCFSGALTGKLVSQVNGMALSPGEVGEETSCQLFSPAFFEDLTESRKTQVDFDQDGQVSVQEAFFTAMDGYPKDRKLNGIGSIEKSVDELTVDNFDKTMKIEGATVVEVGATWCPSCKVFKNEARKAGGMIGDRVNFVSITTDLYDKRNPEDLAALYQRLGVEPPKFIPVVYITTDQGKTFQEMKERTSSEIVEGMKDRGLLEGHVTSKPNQMSSLEQFRSRARTALGLQ